MRKITIGLLIMVLMFVIPGGGTLAVGDEKIAVPSQTMFIMGGQEVSLNAAYDIEGNNYIQLRSIAQMLNGTTSQFNVYWDDIRQQAIIETGKPYTGIKPFIPDKQVYMAGEPIIYGNTEIKIVNISRIRQLDIVEGRDSEDDSSTKNILWYEW